MHLSLNLKLTPLLPLLSIIHLTSSSPLAVPDANLDLEARHHGRHHLINDIVPTSPHTRSITQVIRDSYIVVLKKDVSRAVFRQHVDTYSYSGKKFSIGSFHAYEGIFSSKEEVTALGESPEVCNVSPPIGIRAY